MLESWANMALNDVNTQMWKAINDAGAKRGKKKAQPGIDAARANADAVARRKENDYIIVSEKAGSSEKGCKTRTCEGG